MSVRAKLEFILSAEALVGVFGGRSEQQQRAAFRELADAIDALAPPQPTGIVNPMPPPAVPPPDSTDG